jgi:hypothetical protein
VVPAFLLFISAHWSSWLGGVAYLVLLFAPGAWITFLVPMGDTPFWGRLFTGAMLSPLIVGVEFYIIRFLGIPFGSTAWVLVVLNLPAIYLIWKRRVTAAPISGGTWLVGAAAALIPLAFLLPLLMHPEERIFAPHGWYHADAAYMFARGDFVLEDPTLAGMRMPYPIWSPLMFNAVLSFLVNSPPVMSYIWSDLVCLVAVCSFAAGIAKELGGGKIAQFSSGMWLIAGTTPIPIILVALVPGASRYCCDTRFTSNWVVKFQLFGPMAVALGMLMAVIYLLVRAAPTTNGLLFVICLLGTGIGLLYPLLFPPACGLIVARALAPLADRLKSPVSALYKEWSKWIGILLVASLLTFVEIRFLTAGRLTTESPLSFSTIHSAVIKTIAALIVTSLALAGTLFAFRVCWKFNRNATVTIAGGALASYFLYIVFHIPYYDNEYKFIFAVTMCLFPFPVIAVERIWREWPGYAALPALASLVLLVAGMSAVHAYRNWPAPWAVYDPGDNERDPRVNTAGFYLQLDPAEPWSGVCDAAFRMTPARTVLVLNNGRFYYPGLTARSLYVSAENKSYRGINIYADTLDGDLRGYGKKILAQRRATMTEIFDADDAGIRERAIDTVLSLNRPVAIVVEPQHKALLAWLEHRKTASRLFAQNGLSLWLIEGTGNKS